MVLSWLGGTTKRCADQGGTKVRRFTPRLEALEDRTVLDTVTWIGGSGDWNVPANWSTGSLPRTQDDAVIDQPGITVMHSAETHRINSLVTANGTFQLTGGTLDIATTVRGDSAFQLRGGRLANATLAAGATLTALGSQSALDRITVATGATFELGAQQTHAEVNVYNGLVIDGTANLGHVNSPHRGALYLRGTQSIGGGGRVVMGQGGAAISQTDPEGALTIGAGLTIQGDTLILVSAGTLVNQAPLAVRSVSLGANLPWTNTGTIQQAAFLRLAGPWTSTSEITLANNGRLELRGDYFVNRGTIRVVNAEAVLEGQFRPSGLGNFVRSGGTVWLLGTLDARGETFEFNAGTGSWQGQGCTVLGGTLVQRDGARLRPTNCFLDSVTFDSDVDWSDGVGVHVRNGLTVNGRLLLATTPGSYARLIFHGNPTLTVTDGVVFGGDSSNGFETDGPSVLTIAPNTTIRGRTAEFRTFALLNQGTIMPDAPGSGFTINSGSFINTGTLGASSGGSLTLAGNWQTTVPLQLSGAGRFTLDGNWNYPFPLTVTAGTLILAGNWRSLQQLTVQSATATISNTSLEGWTMSSLTAVYSTVNFGAGFHPSQILSFTRTGGIVNLVGTVNNTSQTLLLDANTGSWNLRAGRIVGGIVRTSGGSRLAATPEGGILDGVTLDGELEMLVRYPRLTVVNGLTLNGTLYLGDPTVDGPGLVLFDGSQTLESTTGGTVAVESGSLRVLGVQTLTLTLAPNITVRGRDGGIFLEYNSTFLNRGLIHADRAGEPLLVSASTWSSPGTLRATNGGRLYLNGSYTLTTPLSVENSGQLTLAGRWTNETTITAAGSVVWLGESDPWFNRGTILVNNCTVVLRGRVTTDDLGAITRTGGTVELAGTLANNGRTLLLDETTGPWRFSGVILGGTVATRGVALVPTRGGRLSNGVVLNGELDLSQTVDAQLFVEGGLTLNGIIRLGNNSGTFVASLEFGSTQTLSTQTGGYVVFGGGLNRINVAIGSNVRVTLGPGIVVQGQRGTLNGSIENQGTIQADKAGGTITISSTLWTNAGTVHALNGGQLLARNPPTNYASGRLIGGTWIVSFGSTLRVVGADIVTNAATILLDGPDASFYGGPTLTDALTNFVTNARAGRFGLRGGRTFLTARAFENAGELTLRGGSGFITADGYTQTDGVTVLENSYLAAGARVHLQAGVLAGSGYLVGDVVNAARIDVGGAGVAGALTLIGGYEQTATGVLNLEIGAVGRHDELRITGAAALAGTLNVRLLAGYQFSAGDFFTPLTFASRTGQFTEVNLPDPGGGLAFVPFLGDDVLYLFVTGG